MKNIGIIFGGKSVEREVSVVTAFQIKNAIENNYNIKMLYLNNENELFLVNNKASIKNVVNNENMKKVCFCKNGIHYNIKKTNIDCIINACHGGIGENGELAAILNFFHIPITSSSVLASKITMSKSMTKKMLVENNINTVEYEIIKNIEQLNQLVDNKKSSEGFLPVIVKPNSLGSSIGVSLCDNIEKLYEAVNICLLLDDACLIEKYIFPLTEYNCAVAVIDGKIQTSEIERPLSEKELLTFEEKYLSGNSKGMKNLSREMPAKISTELQAEIERVSVNIYKYLELSGVVRIDYIFDSENDVLFLNEINNVPGSLSGYMFEGRGVPFSILIDNLINNATTFHNDKITEYDSKILK